MNKLILGLLILGLAAGYSCNFEYKPEGTEKSTYTIFTGSSADEYRFSPAYNLPDRQMIFLTLFLTDENGEPEGRLVESWEHSEDFKTWTYYLRKNINWHDGVPVTAHDIQFTFELLCHPEVLRVRADAFSFELLDDYTFKIEYKDRTLNPLNGWDVFYPKHLLENLDPKELGQWDFWKQPVGNGPFRYVRHEPDVFFEFEANPDFYRGKPRIDRIIFRSGGDPFVELLSGNVDVISFKHSEGGEALLKMTQDPRFRIIKGESVYAGLFWNHKHSFFKDYEVRLALTHAINRRELFHLNSVPDDIPIIDGPSYWRRRHRDPPEAISYDPDKAIKLLAEAGWKDLNGDGILERNGEDFRFTVDVWNILESSAIYVQAQLQRVGIRVEIQIMNRGMVDKKIGSCDFEAAIYRLRDGEISKFIANSTSGPGVGYEHSAELKKMLDQALEDWSPDWLEKRELKIWKFLTRDVPVTYLQPSMYVTVVHKKVKGPFETRPLEDLWIEEE